MEERENTYQSWLEDAITNLQSNLARIIKCRSLSKEDLAGKYRKSYEDLIAQARRSVNAYADVIACRGYVGGQLPTKELQAAIEQAIISDPVAMAGLESARQQCVAAMMEGNVDGIHSYAEYCRALVSVAASPLNVRTDPLYDDMIKLIKKEPVSE